MDKNNIARAINTFAKMETEARLIKRLTDDLAKEVKRLTDKEMVEYVATTSAIEKDN